MNRKNEIVFSISAFLFFLFAEILIGIFASGWIRNSFGDILVIAAMYFLIRIFTDKFRRTLPLILFIFACFVEFMQYLDICGFLGIRKGSLLSIIIGTTAKWGDIICYGTGALLVYIFVIICFYAERSRKNG